MSLSKQRGMASRRLALFAALGTICLSCVLCLPVAAWTGTIPQASIKAAVLQLQESTSATDRARAVVTIAQNAKSVTPETLSVMVGSLYCDQDQLVRGIIASAFGEIAAKQQDGLEPGPNELLMLEAMLTSYSIECDPVVRRNIAIASSRFNHAQTTKLINQAISDPEPLIQLLGKKAKLHRDMRLTKLVTG